MWLFRRPLPRPGLGPRSLQKLREEGFWLVKSVVPAELVAAARRLINHRIGEVGLPPERLGEFNARSFTPELMESSPITDLFLRTRLPRVVEAALGRGQLAPPTRGQIALRFPNAGKSAAVPHIDGIPTADNGVPAGTLLHFTALCGVFLTDVLAEDRGNFTVWPGGHKKVAAHLQAHGADGFVGGFPKLQLPPARQITARAGDAVFAHYQLPHGIAPNLGSDVRFAVFFRLYHRRHAEYGQRPLSEPWLEWPGLTR